MKRLESDKDNDDLKGQLEREVGKFKDLVGGNEDKANDILKDEGIKKDDIKKLTETDLEPAGETPPVFDEAPKF